MEKFKAFCGYLIPYEREWGYDFGFVFDRGKKKVFSFASSRI